MRVALAADTVSILVMEIVDNAVMLAVPGAMEAGIGGVAVLGRRWPVALAVAFVVTLPINRALMSRGKGHAVVHACMRLTSADGRPTPDSRRPRPPREVGVARFAAPLEAAPAAQRPRRSLLLASVRSSSRIAGLLVRARAWSSARRVRAA